MKYVAIIQNMTETPTITDVANEETQVTLHNQRSTSSLICWCGSVSINRLECAYRASLFSASRPSRMTRSWAIAISTFFRNVSYEIGRASCRERVCQYV